MEFRVYASRPAKRDGTPTEFRIMPNDFLTFHLSLTQPGAVMGVPLSAELIFKRKGTVLLAHASGLG